MGFKDSLRVLKFSLASLISVQIFAHSIPAFASDESYLDRSELGKTCKGKRSTTMAVVGGGLGAVLGIALGKEGHKTEAAALGAGAGAGLGYLVGKSWDKRACEASRRAQALALQSASTQSWSDGARSYTYSVDRTYAGNQTFQKDLPVVSDRSLALSNVADAVGVYQVTSTRVNVRDRPDLTGASRVVDQAKSGDRLLVMGKSADDQWLLVSLRGAAAEGWVSRNGITPTNENPAVFAKVDKRPIRAERVAIRQQCIEAHEVFVAEGKTQTSRPTQVCKNAEGDYA